MNIWEAITGIIIVVVSLMLFWQTYNTVAQCNSIGGQISTAIGSLFGGTNAQQCYNSGIIEVASIFTAIIGVIIVYAAVKNKAKK
jgi:uncharacterized membrane protein